MGRKLPLLSCGAHRIFLFFFFLNKSEKLPEELLQPENCLM